MTDRRPFRLQERPGWLLLSTINGDHTNGSDPVTAPVAVTDGVVPLERQP